MIGYIARKLFTQFGKKYQYDVTYMVELANIYPKKTWRFMFLTAMNMHYSAVPKDLYFAVKICATKLADCGECTMLEVNLAIEAGVDKQQLRYLLKDDLEHLNDDMLLGFNYAREVEKNSLEMLDIITEIEIRYGKKGLWDLSAAFTMGQLYPKLKRGLGEAATCYAPTALAEEI